MNFFESGAAVTVNTGESNGQTVLEYAREKNIAILVNRPLNAMVAPNRMLRLADLPLEDPPIDIDQYLSKVGALEQEYRTSLHRISLRPKQGRHRRDTSIGLRNCTVFVSRFKGSNIGNILSTR